MTRPTPAPTSRARIRREGEVEEVEVEVRERGRTAEGTVQRVGRRCWRNWRDVSASIRGRDYQSAMCYYYYFMGRW